jgi:hypothetical protein
MESEVRWPPDLIKGWQQLIAGRQTEAVKEIDSIFPEGLRSRVLEFVQFRNTARMDDLGTLLNAVTCDLILI